MLVFGLEVRDRNAEREELELDLTRLTQLLSLSAATATTRPPPQLRSLRLAPGWSADELMSLLAGSVRTICRFFLAKHEMKNARQIT